MNIKNRCIYLLIAVIILIAEILIALFVRDAWIRPYGGDVLAVAFVYCGIRILIIRSVFLPAVLSLACACCLETLQAFHLTSLSWIASNRILVVVLGSTFDYSDLLLYGLGAFLSFSIDTAIRKKYYNVRIFS
jgi:hypothetical protein